MLKNQGVYTIKCPKCSRTIIIHLESDGVISHKKCSDCQMEFEGLDVGEGRNSFVVVPKVKKTGIFGGEVAEENKEDKKPEEASKPDEEPLETFSLPKKAVKKSFKW